MTDKTPRGFWCEFNDKGQCLDLIEAPRGESPGSEYVWIQEDGEDCDLIREQMKYMLSELRSVLSLMDQLAEQLGDEAVFRRCRIRLRNLCN